MKLFCKENNAPIYTVTIKDNLRFDLAMDYIGIGLSCSDRRWQPSRKPRTARRQRNLLASMTASSVSTRASWLLSLSRCNKSPASSTMSRFGPCHLLATEARITANRSPTYAYMSAIAASWSTCTSSQCPCSNVIPLSTFSI